MLTWTRHFLSALVFEDLEKTRISQLLSDMLNVILGISLLTTVVLIALQRASFFKNWYSPAIMVVTIAVTLLLRILLQRGYIGPTSILLSLTFASIVFFATLFYGGIPNSTTAGYLLCIIMAGLLLGGRGAMVFTGISLAAVFGTWYLWQQGQLPRSLSSGSESSLQNFALIANSGFFVISGLLLRYAASSIAQAMEQVRRKEQAEAQANQELRKLRDSLEQQVAERTQALERRTRQLQAAAQVGSTVAAVLETQSLARQVVELVCEQFELYLVEIYLVDESGEWAELQASSGKVGQTALTRSLRVPAKGGSLISQCVGSARIQTAARADQVPEARAAAALPLLSRQRMFGVLVVYSDQAGLLDQGTLTVLETVSDQVAIALDNARLFAANRAALEQAQRAYGEFSQHAWTDLLRVRPNLSKRKDQSGIFQAAGTRTPEAQAALQTGQSIAGLKDKAGLATPIKVRDHIIGVLDARKPGGADREAWTADEIRLIESLTEQLGVALDSARLYQDTQRRAARERILREVTARMRSSSDPETVLSTLLKEVGTVLGRAAFVRLGSAEQLAQAPETPPDKGNPPGQPSASRAAPGAQGGQ